MMILFCSLVLIMLFVVDNVAVLGGVIDVVLFADDDAN